MKKIGISLCAITLMLAATTQSFAQKVDEIIQKHIVAIGGEENWKKVNTMKMEGSVSAQGMEIGVTQTIVHNKGMRQDISVMGMTGYTIMTPTEGWNFMPFGGQTEPEAMTADMVNEGKSKLDIQGDLIDYKTKGTKIDLLGKDDVEGTEVFKLKVVKKDGKEKTLFIDTKNYFVIREIEKIKADGKEMEVPVDYSNYQKQSNGIVFPMTLGTQQGEVTFKNIEINAKVDESIFKPSK